MRVIVFALEDKEYGIDIQYVSEVIRVGQFTPIPETAEYIAGVVTRRGAVVPLINLKKKFQYSHFEIEKTQRVIICRVGGHLVGLVVDRVSDVLKVDPADISPPDEFLKQAQYLIGLVKVRDRLILISDVEKMLGREATSAITDLKEHIDVRQKGD